MKKVFFFAKTDGVEFKTWYDFMDRDEVRKYLKRSVAEKLWTDAGFSDAFLESDFEKLIIEVYQGPDEPNIIYVWGATNFGCSWDDFDDSNGIRISLNDEVVFNNVVEASDEESEEA